MKFQKLTSKCLAVSLNEDGDILCSMEGGIEIRSAHDLKLLRNIPLKNDHVESAFSVDGELIMKLYSPKNHSVGICKGNIVWPNRSICASTKESILHRVTHMSAKGYRFAFFRASNPVMLEINRGSSHPILIELDDMMTPRGVHILPDVTVVISDLQAGELRKYNIQNSLKSTPLWRCRGLTSPYGLTSDHFAVIYTLSTTNRGIYMV